MRRLRALNNYNLAEPSQLVGVYGTEATIVDYPTLRELIVAYENLTFE